MAYINRNAKLEMENERGEIFKDKDAIRDLHKDWMADIDQQEKPNVQRHNACHLVYALRYVGRGQSEGCSRREFKQGFKSRIRFCIA